MAALPRPTILIVDDEEAVIQGAPSMRPEKRQAVQTLFESELFGHVRGAFTGATDNKPGLLEIA